MTRYDGPRSPTPKRVYDKRWFRVHLIGKGLGRGGVSFVFHGPYGIGMTVAQVLARAVARGQITKYGYAYLPPKEIDEHRDVKGRFEKEFEALGKRYGFDWGA